MTDFHNKEPRCVDGGHCVIFEVSVKCRDDPYLCILEKREREHFPQGTRIRVIKPLGEVVHHGRYGDQSFVEPYALYMQVSRSSTASPNYS
nr:hypothetical protein CFP56_69941 [Quercus suber]